MATRYSSRTEHKDMLRYRLSTEECLLRWLDHGLRGNQVSFQAGRFMLTPNIMLEVEEPRLNPYADGDEAYGGEFAESVLTSLGLNPEYSHANGRNRIRFRMKKKSPGQIATLCIALGVAALVGALGTIAIPESIRDTLLSVVIDPLYSLFFRILGCIAGPMIFLSVAWGVYGLPRGRQLADPVDQEGGQGVQERRVLHDHDLPEAGRAVVRRPRLRRRLVSGSYQKPRSASFYSVFDV